MCPARRRSHLGRLISCCSSLGDRLIPSGGLLCLLGCGLLLEFAILLRLTLGLYNTPALLLDLPGSSLDFQPGVVDGISLGLLGCMASQAVSMAAGKATW